MLFSCSSAYFSRTEFKRIRFRSILQNFYSNNHVLCAKKQSADSEGNVLVIVESPTKARTIQKILAESGENYVIEYCAGHLRDLATHQKDYKPDFQSKNVYTPLRIKTTDLGVDVFQNFEPYYVTIEGKGELVNRIKQRAKVATRILLATDEDREGESISWHLLQIIKPKVPYKVS
jgi:DNA topoisomerase I